MLCNSLYDAFISLMRSITNARARQVPLLRSGENFVSLSADSALARGQEEEARGKSKNATGMLHINECIFRVSLVILSSLLQQQKYLKVVEITVVAIQASPSVSYIYTHTHTPLNRQNERSKRDFLISTRDAFSF
jgi:hypothetical protein